MSNEPTDFLPPAIKGYRFIRVLARGGQGVVLEALQESTKQKVAVKILLNVAWASEAERKRFEREVELVAQLKHPNIIRVFDAGQTTRGMQYCVMEYIRGQCLNHYVHDQRPPLQRVLEIFAEVCDGVQYAHQKGVIHRDLKPHNVLVDALGIPRVLDFGYAKMLAAPTDPGVSDSQYGVGTVPYWSPEQAKGTVDEIDALTDVYALGVMLYEALAGEFPYPIDEGLEELLHHIKETPPTPLRRAWNDETGVRARLRGQKACQCPLDNEVETIVSRCLAKERARRYQSAGELARDIRHYLAGEPIEARPDSPAYVMRTRVRRFIDKNRRISMVAAVVLTCVLAELVVTPLIARTPAHSYLSRLLTAYAAPSEPMTAFEHVRVIGLTDETDVEEIAKQEGLVGVTKGNVRSLRRLHGRMMEKLVGTGIRALVWDITFRSATEFDKHFARGAQALRDEGVDVIVAVKGWWGYGPPKTSPMIEPVVRTGAVTAHFGAGGPWQLLLVVDRPWQEARLTLTLRALASYRLPDSEVEITGRGPSHDLTLSYWRPASGTGRGWRRARVTDRVVLSEYSLLSKSWPEIGLRPGDRLGYYVVRVPRQEVLEASTIDYSQVFSAGRDELGKLLSGKLVFVCDMRGDRDRYGHPSGRLVPGCYGHASAIERILGRGFVGAPTRSEALSMSFAAAVLGLVIASRMADRTRGRFAILGAIVLALLLASLIAYRVSLFLVIPVGQVFAVVVSCELAAAVIRVCQRRDAIRA